MHLVVFGAHIDLDKFRAYRDFVKYISTLIHVTLRDCIRCDDQYRPQSVSSRRHGIWFGA